MRISDWSSDVCSSDLPRAELIAVAMTSLISRRPLDGFVAGRGLALLRVSAADKILNRAQIGEGWILDFPLNKLREPMPVNASNRSCLVNGQTFGCLEIRRASWWERVCKDV